MNYKAQFTQAERQELLQGSSQSTLYRAITDNQEQALMEYMITTVFTIQTADQALAFVGNLQGRLQAAADLMAESMGQSS